MTPHQSLLEAQRYIALAIECEQGGAIQLAIVYRNIAAEHLSLYFELLKRGVQ